MIDVIQPEEQGLIQLGKRISFEARQKVPPHGSEEPLYFSLSLWFVRPCMDESDPKACRDVFQMMGAKGTSIVRIDFSG